MTTTLQTHPVLDLISDRGIPFRFVLQRAGSALERNPGRPYTSRHDVVCVFDLRFPHTANGQFVADYHVNTLSEREPTGIRFYTPIPEWSIDYIAEGILQRWLANVTTRDRIAS